MVINVQRIWYDIDDCFHIMIIQSINSLFKSSSFWHVFIMSLWSWIYLIKCLELLLMTPYRVSIAFLDSEISLYIRIKNMPCHIFCNTKSGIYLKNMQYICTNVLITEVLCRNFLWYIQTSISGIQWICKNILSFM